MASAASPVAQADSTLPSPLSTTCSPNRSQDGAVLAFRKARRQTSPSATKMYTAPEPRESKEIDAGSPFSSLESPGAPTASVYPSPLNGALVFALEQARRALEATGPTLAHVEHTPAAPYMAHYTAHRRAMTWFALRDEHHVILAVPRRLNVKLLLPPGHRWGPLVAREELGLGGRR